MGKKSKRRIGKTGATASGTSHPSVASSCTSTASVRNAIQRQKLLCPEDWATSVASIHPFVRPDIPFSCLEAQKFVEKTASSNNSSISHGRAKSIREYAHCPMCLKNASEVCSKCRTVYYCSAECQKAHWKLSHKKACQPNPKKYRMNLDLTQVFQGLEESCFEGHEFLVVKPSEKLSSLAEICDQVLAPADDLFDIPGFGAQQLNHQWLIENSEHPIYRQLVERFGWTSGFMGLELVNGYRLAEAKFVYFVYCDDAFERQTGLTPSYYGKALFPPGKRVRGNLVIFKCMLNNKRRKANPLNASSSSSSSSPLYILLADDSDLEYEFILSPINKAEIAHLMSERRNAMEQGAYTHRMWRYSLRQAERQNEMEKGDQNNRNSGNSNIAPVTIAF